MHFEYCPRCGQKLKGRPAGDDGLVPFCDVCNQYWFDSFPSCVIILVANEFNEIALLRQSYLSDKYCSFVAGYITPGETAENTAIREVREEIGVELESLKFGGTVWFKKRGQLMIGFIGKAQKQELTLSSEVDSARWVKAEEAPKYMFPDRPDNASFHLYRQYMKSLEV